MAYRINKDIINRNKINKDGINKVSIIKTAFKIFTAATMLLLFLPPSDVWADTEDTPQTEYFTGQISGIDEYSASQLWDNNSMTCFKGDSIDITISSDKKFTAAYLVWNTIPGAYTITSSSNEKYSIEDGFLHKLVEFDNLADSFRLECPGGVELCDLYLFSGENYPDFVQRWEAPCRQADILVLSAHADDEYLMFGGTIPYYAKERGLNVQVAYLTTHFDEQPRPHELLNGLWTAGVKNYPVFGVISDIPLKPIHSLEEADALYDLDMVLEWFVAQIRIFKPSVIVTHDINGEYGHGAHMLAAKTVQDAVAVSADSSYYPDSANKYGVWDVPKTYLHFWEENKIVMDWEQPLDSFGGLTARDAAELAYNEHKSQHKWGFIVGYWEQYDIRRFGLYRTLVGVDEKADFMDHIEPVKVIEETTTPEAETQTSHETSEGDETAIPKETSPATDASETAKAPTPSNKQPENQSKPSAGIVIIAAITAAIAIIAAVGIIIKIIKKKAPDRKK